MRSFFCFVRLQGTYEMLTCSVHAERLDKLPSLAFQEFARKGVKVKAADVARMRFVGDPRNVDVDGNDGGRAGRAHAGNAPAMPLEYDVAIGEYPPPPEPPPSIH